MSPYMKAVLAALATAALLLLSIFASISSAAERLRAPVVADTKEPGVMKVVGWFSYDEYDKGYVLFCKKQTPTKLACVVLMYDGYVVVVPDILATELDT